MNKFLYIAYGSNLNIRQMAYRCPFATPVGVSEIKGYELRFRGSQSGNYLTIEPEPHREVPVAIWAVSGEDLKRLDTYEGYPYFYRREYFKVKVKGKYQKAIVYIMNDGRPYGPPSNSYMATCLEGYKDFGFDPEYLYEAVRKSKELKEND